MQTERAISEANVQIGRHYKTRHGKRGKRREVGMTTGAESTRSPWIAPLVRRCRSVRRSAPTTGRRAGRPRSTAAANLAGERRELDRVLRIFRFPADQDSGRPVDS